MTNAISGLILAIAVVGFIELNINESVRGIVTQAIQDDLELEDRAEEVRLAVLDIRHYHDNLVFGGPTPRRIQEFDAAYQNLLAKIDALDEVHLTTRQSPTADELRQMAEDYYTTFRPAIELFAHDRRSFELASDEGLMLLARLERAVRQLERLGEQLADQSVAEVQSSVNHVRMLLVGKLVGHILIGATLALMIVRIIQDQQRVAADLANTLQIKSDFIADISHELRTPLTVLRANAEVALDLDRTCVHTEMLEEIVRESSHMTHLVEDLLFLARSDAGALPYAWETVNLRALLNDFAERAQPLVRKYGAHIRVHLTADGHVRVDRMRLVQALLILVDNAAKYGSDGNIITLTLKQVANQAQIEVVDNGPGIPAEDLAKIFERFYRVDQARSNEKESTGLGLAIAKSIIAAHGGRIEAESAIHQGATMRCYLPLIKAPNAVRLPAEARLTNTAA
ncbi:MAG: ATP-binding protein [Caldilineaceae bacterium]